MKKIILSLALLAGICMTAGAQQLPNVGFENWKGSGNAGSTYQSSKTSLIGSTNGGLRQRPGDEPTDWMGSSINQKVIGIEKKQEVLYKAGTTSNYYVKLVNTFVGVSTFGSNAPGYLTFGTPWVYAVSDISSCDGGTYGGMSFGYKPDAIRGKYKKTPASKAENSYIIAYIWNGTFTSQIASTSTNDADRLKDDVDRAILGSVSGTGVTAPSRVTESGKLIAWCNYAFKNSTTADPDWETIEVPLNYVADNILEAPTKMNVVICAGDYWTRDNIQNGTTLEVDDVEFVYNSQLKSLSVDGNSVPSFNKDTYDYTIDAFYTEGTTQIEYEDNTLAGVAAVNGSYDSETAKYTIVVKGQDFSENASNTHTYTIQFNLPAPAKSLDATYDGKAIAFTDNAAEYSGVYHPERLSLEYSNEGATIQRFYDGETGLMTILVTDGDDVSTYTIKFEAPTSSTSYKEFLIVGINGETTAPQEATMYMYDMSDGSKTLVLKNFVLGGELPVGNISLAGVTLNSDKSYASEQTIDISNGDASQGYWMGPMLGPVPVNMTGYAFDDKFLAHIDINMATLGQTIEVKFGYNYTRTVAADRWGTLCQPFSFTAEQVAATGFKFYSIEGVKTTNGAPQYISLKEEESVQGGMPYIFFSGENTALSLMGGTGYAESPSDKNGLFGVYTRKDLDGGTYILSNNKICGGYANYVEANRAYIDINDVPELDSNAKGVRFYFNDTTTGIGSLNTEQTSAKAYDLAGRRVTATAKGIYIVNGKKIVLK